MPPSWSDPHVATAGLIVANLVPLVGVVVFGWNLHSLLVGYWLESGVIGAAFLAKLRHAAGEDDPDDLPPIGVLTDALDESKRTIAGSFLSYYGVFWIGHGSIVWSLPLNWTNIDNAALDVVAVTLLSLVVYHAVSYRVNYVGQGEYRRTGPVTLMVDPYRRLFVLHLAVLLGGIAISRFGAPVGALAVLILMKTTLDLWSHRTEHPRERGRTPEPSPAGSTE